MSPIDWALRPLQRYANFSGRAPRPEYWWFILMQVILGAVASILDSLLGMEIAAGFGIFYLLVALGLFIPGIAAAVRRLHDTDHSGWWLLLLIVPIIGFIVILVFLVSAGTPGNNRFGAPDNG